MFGTVVGAIVLLFGLVLVGYTVYNMATHTPTNSTDWVFQSLYIVGGLIVAYYGYETIYPPQPALLFGGRRRR
jgi:hypothetical protein